VHRHLGDSKNQTRRTLQKRGFSKEVVKEAVTMEKQHLLPRDIKALKEYITRNFRVGISKAKIRRALLQVGWRKTLVDKVLNELK
tara:strand:- start:325 stop:579 length:255 start_codon:yes stop_codon:yes gene_type:complete